MPFHLSGELTVTAIQDLGGMGANASAPEVCEVSWTPPVWESIPWLLLAGALWFERRRKRGNRWIVLALAAGFAVLWILTKAATFVPGSLADVLESVFRALIYGHAIMWLASARLAHPKRGATFLRMFVVMCVASATMLCASIDVFDDGVALPSFIALLVLLSATMVGFQAAAFGCRRHPSVSWFIGISISTCFVFLCGLFSLIIGLEGGQIGWSLCLAISGGLTGAMILGLIPVILVLFLHPAQTSRLTELLHFKP